MSERGDRGGGRPAARAETPAAPPPASAASLAPAAVDNRRTVAEIFIVLGVSLGQDAVYAVISLLAKLTAGRPLAQQQATLNSSLSPRPYLDLTYQLAGIAFTLVPVALVLWLLSGSGRSATARLGLDFRQPWRDLGLGVLLAVVIGLPGLGLYLAGHALGITATVVPEALAPHWWSVPVLVLQALKNAVVEEVVVVGYLITRLRELGWSAPAMVAASAILRGSYHLYQGFGPFLGNAVMGVVFAELFRRRGRVAPLIVAHTLLDLVAFVGYEFFGSVVGLR